MQVADGRVEIAVAGVLDRHGVAGLRVTLLEVCALSAGEVLLNLDAVSRLEDGSDLSELLSEAQTRCWTTPCRLQVTAVNPAVLQAITSVGITCCPTVQHP